MESGQAPAACTRGIYNSRVKCTRAPPAEAGTCATGIPDYTLSLAKLRAPVVGTTEYSAINDCIRPSYTQTTFALMRSAREQCEVFDRTAIAVRSSVRTCSCGSQASPTSSKSSIETKLQYEIPAAYTRFDEESTPTRHSKLLNARQVA